MKAKKTGWLKPTCIAVATVLVLGGLAVGITWCVRHLAVKEEPKAKAENILVQKTETHNEAWQDNAVKEIESRVANM